MRFKKYLLLPLFLVSCKIKPDAKIGIITDSFGASPWSLFSPVSDSLHIPVALDAVSGRCLAHGTDRAMRDGIDRLSIVDGIEDFLMTVPNITTLLISAGSNDYYFSVPVGSSQSNDISTSAGALKETILRVKTIRPNVKIILILPSIRRDQKKDGSAGGLANIEGMRILVDTLRKIGQREDCVIVDQFNNPHLNYASSEINAPDGVHWSTPSGKNSFIAPILEKINDSTHAGPSQK